MRECGLLSTIENWLKKYIIAIKKKQTKNSTWVMSLKKRKRKDMKTKLVLLSWLLEGKVLSVFAPCGMKSE